MRAFIIRPFGTKRGIDFERVDKELIDPALTRFAFAGRTTGEILEAGNIRTDMFQQLLLADLVIADISTNNANAFYELGIRHALRDRHTFLLRSKTVATAAGQEKEEVPFDLRTDRYLAYDPADPAGSLQTLIDGLQQTLAGDRIDSPVFLSLPALRVQERSSFTPVPAEFAEEVAIAVAAKQPAKLALLALEVRDFTWEVEGLRVVGRAQFAANYLAGARNTWETLRKSDPGDQEANLLLGTIYQRMGDLTNSNLSLERVVKAATAAPPELAEVNALLGRNIKQLWQNEWYDLTPVEDRPSRAFESPLLADAYQHYRKAFMHDLNACYPGLNALALLVVILELAGRYSDIWKNRFEDDSKAELELTELRKQRDELAAAMACSIRANKTRKGNSDPWLNITEADYRLLTSSRPSSVAFAYKGVEATIQDFMKDSIRRQLDMYRQLGVLTENVNAAWPVFGRAAPQTPGPSSPGPAAKLDHVIVFTGHRIDDKDRKSPRFPADCEEKARAEIHNAVLNVKSLTAGPVLGIAGAASGGDILFLEECRKLGVATKICLALPADKYLAASVTSSGGTWVRRFYDLGAAASDLPVLAETPELPRWLRVKKGYDIWQRNNLWELSHAMVCGAAHMTLLALWDGKKGDGPGGTEHMVRIARERDANVVILDTEEICGLKEKD